MTPRRASVRAATFVAASLACTGGVHGHTSVDSRRTERFSQSPPSRSIWQGVYGAAQADRGKALYQQHCSACHGDFLDGDGADGRHVALIGMAFAESWESASVNDLFSKIRRTMPQSAPGALTDAEALDVSAFLLEANGFPAGASELRPTLQLALIDIVGRGGPQPLRVGSGVRAVGCLTARGDRGYVLTRASPLVRTKSPNSSAGLDVDRAMATALGSDTVTLVSVGLGPLTPVGAKVEVRGALTVIAPTRTVAVTSVQLLDDTCRD